MDALFERDALRYHRRLLKMHEHALAACKVRRILLGVLWHSFAVDVERVAVAWHQVQLWKRGEK